MSTKIYEAWRWKRTLGMSWVLHEVETIMKRQMYKKAQEFLAKCGADSKAGNSWEQREVMAMCAKLTLFQALSPYKGPQGDFSCDFCVWDYKSYFYMYPIGTLNNWDFSEIYKIPCLEDFRYWNNTDEPEGMTRREWNRRGRIWDAQHSEAEPVPKTIYHVLDPYSPTHDLQPLFDPRWATDFEMKRYGLPTCMRLTQKKAQRRAKQRVRCKFCKNLVPKKTAHRHQGKWVGDACCWDERLRTTE